MNEEASLKNPPKGERLSRRRFLRIAGVTALVATVGVLDWRGKYSTLAKYLDDLHGGGQFSYDNAVQEAKVHFKERYGIDILAGPEDGQQELLGNRPTLEQYRATLRVIWQELSKYPPEMMRALGDGLGLEMRIIDEPTVKEDAKSARRVRVGGTSPHVKEGKPVSLIFEAGEPEVFQRRGVHHELNHRFAEKWQTWDEREARWVSFHANVTAHPYHPEPEGTRLDDKAAEPYFLTMHASNNFEEDQGICAEWLMTPEKHFEFVERIKNEKDPKVKDILSWKYKETVNNYKTWGGDHFKNQFWIDIYERGKEEQQRKNKRTS
jgi:hypothetical protein